MKKIILGICFNVLIAASMSAQSLVMNEDSVWGYGLSNELDIVLDNMITSNLGYFDSIRWERVVNDKPAAWSTLVCDPTTCWAAGVNTMGFDFDDGESGLLLVHFKPNNTPGYGIVDLLVWSYIDSANTAMHVIYLCNVDQFNHVETKVIVNTVAIFPNPATTVLNLTNATSKSLAKVEIYNILGSVIKTFRFEKTNEISHQVDVINLQQGLYLLKAFTDDDEVIVSKTFKKVE